MDWWNGLSAVNQAFYCAAVFFSVPFLWQLAAAFVGLSGGGDVDHDGLGGAHDGHSAGGIDHGVEADSVATVLAFKMLSLRSLFTFFTLFCWGTALYLNRGTALTPAMGISVLWGFAGMASVALVLTILPKLAQTGTKDIGTCVGREATVYLDIPANGVGEIRATVSGVVCHVKARAAEGKAIKAGAAVRVTRRLDGTTVEVA